MKVISDLRFQISEFGSWMIIILPKVNFNKSTTAILKSEVLNLQSVYASA
jgi:hypothetical protein